jgi:hypothetical protein
MKTDLAFPPSSREYVPAAASRSLAPIARMEVSTGASETSPIRIRLLGEAFLGRHADARAGNPAERGGLQMIAAIHTGCGPSGDSTSRPIPSRRLVFANKELGGVHEEGAF